MGFVEFEGGGEDAEDAGVAVTDEFVPLWNFENRKGRLRYLPSLAATGGKILADGEWLGSRSSAHHSSGS